MAEEKAKKVNNASKYISKDVIVIAVVLIAIAAYIIAECYSATHVDIQTVTAVKSTVYQTLDKKALAISSLLDNNNSIASPYWSISCVILFSACDRFQSAN